MIEQISRLCSFENLKNLEVNKSGYVCDVPIKNSSFFRKGEVGDWMNHLTPAMAERVKNLMESKFQGSGLIFKT
ncbi:UNVERIFIED_CONTAM: Cytosolic sulfotransferase 11 [Sesamum latifolium]|uniref:Sulfotransferase n=1 Tax=Sesamum latifolium TaxID=2727402 RepID=A0AAW2WZY4_9LAMI